MYQPVFSIKTGWILGRIQDHVAKPISQDEIEDVCKKLNEEKIPKTQATATSPGMKIVYIAHPIAGGISGNIEKILKIVKEINLMKPDVVPLVPYLADVLALDDDNTEERNRGIRNDIAVLKSGMIKELWIYGPKVSTGMEAEIELAFDLDIPVIVMDAETIWPRWLRLIATEGY